METKLACIYDLLDQRSQHARRLKGAEINAARCQARLDWDNLHKQEEAYEQAREEIASQLLQLVTKP